MVANTMINIMLSKFLQNSSSMFIMLSNHSLLVFVTCITARIDSNRYNTSISNIFFYLNSRSNRPTHLRSHCECITQGYIHFNRYFKGKVPLIDTTCKSLKVWQAV